jgi:hypothetical protein
LIAPKGADAWDDATEDDYDAQIKALKEAPEGALSEENRATITQLLDGLDWVLLNGNDIDLSTISDWPTYSGDFAADCVEPVVAAVDATLGMENSKSVVQAVAVVDDDNKGVEITAVTGWKKFGGGTDASFGYQLAVDFASSASWNLQGSNAVTLIFGNDSTVTELEYNEF